MVRALWQVSSESLVPDFQQPPYDLGAFREIVHHRTRNRGQSFEASFTKTISQRGASNPRKPPHEVATFTVTFEPRDGFPYPTIRQGYRSKTELALEMVGRAQERGHLKAGWVAADDAFGMSPSFREGLAALGMWYVLDVPSGFTVWPPEPAWTSAEYQGFGRPRKPRLRDGQRRTMEQRSDERRPGVRLRWPREARGHAATFSAPRGCDRPAGAGPAKSTGPSTAGTGTAANPATTCPMLRRIPRWRPWHTWEAPGGV